MYDVSSGLLRSSTSFLEQKLTKTKRRRDQYTDLDSINKNETHSLENDEEVADCESESMGNRLGNRGAQSWNSLRAVVRYYCSLRKIKRQYDIPFN